MRKMYKIIGGMLVAGVLIAGIGSGVAFAEYSKFGYGGEKVLENSKYITKTLDYQVPKQGEVEEKQKLYVEILEDHWRSTIEEDASVPKNTIRFEIQYLTDRNDIKPKVEERTWTNQGNKVKKYIQLDSAYSYNEIRDYMRIKDVLLEDLKAHTLSDYQMDGVKSIKILVNPDADFLITLNSDDFYNAYRYEEAIEDVTETFDADDFDGEYVKETRDEVEASTEVFEGVEETGDGIEATTEVVYEDDILEE